MCVLCLRPPDKGSFPLDHFNECSDFKAEYVKCLKEHNYDNMSCRYLSKRCPNMPLQQAG